MDGAPFGGWAAVHRQHPSNPPTRKATAGKQHCPSGQPRKTLTGHGASSPLRRKDGTTMADKKTEITSSINFY